MFSSSLSLSLSWCMVVVVEYENTSRFSLSLPAVPSRTALLCVCWKIHHRGGVYRLTYKIQQERDMDVLKIQQEREMDVLKIQQEN